MKKNPFLQKAKIHRIVLAGQRIYAKIRQKYERKYHGKFLAIEIKSGNVFLGATGSEAMLRAKKKYPDKVFYLERIGFDAAYSILSPIIVR